jgi:hypothetical protein
VNRRGVSGLPEAGFPASILCYNAPMTNLISQQAALLQELQEDVAKQDFKAEQLDIARKVVKRKIFECFEEGIGIDIIAEIVGVTRKRIDQIIREVRPFD